MEKMEKDGMVAFLYSPGYGAGWSTWADSKHKELALFDKGLIQLALDGADAEAVENYLKSKMGDDYFYTGGWRDIKVEWVSKGTSFVIDEYDGNESYQIYGEVERYVA